MISRDRTFTVSAAVLSVIYIALRFWGLVDSCLWFDEIFGVQAAEQQFEAMLWFVAQDLVHPPLFYILLKGWIAVGGESLLWLRAFSVVFSCLALVPFLLMCKQLKLSFSARLTALAFFAVNGSMIKYAQEVRMYGPLLFLSLVSTWLFTRFFFRGKNIWLLTLVNILLVYTHYFGWLVVVSQVAAVLIFQRVKIRHVLIMFGLMILSYVPWIWALLQAYSAAGIEQNIGWMEKPAFRALVEFAFDVVEPFYAQQTSLDLTTILAVSLPLVAAVAAAKTIYLLTWKDRDDHGSFLLLSVLTVVPLLLAFVLSWLLPVSIWGTRHLIVMFPLMFIVIGLVIDGVDIKPLKVGLLSLIAILFAAGFLFRLSAPQANFIWCTWAQQAENLSATEKATVYVFEDLVAYHFWFATRFRPNIEIIKVNGMPEMQEDKAYFLPRGFDGVKTAAPEEIGGEQFWVAFRDMQWNDKHPPINYLEGRGFEFGAPAVIDASQAKSIMVNVRK